MSEERFPGDIQRRSPSVGKTALLVAGAGIGVMLLFCGGIIGYVAWTNTESQSEEGAPVPAAADKPGPTAIRSMARRLAQVDLPADFEPLSSAEVMMITSV